MTIKMTLEEAEGIWERCKNLRYENESLRYTMRRTLETLEAELAKGVKDREGLEGCAKLLRDVLG